LSLGLSALLNAKNLHHSKYHSLGLAIRRVCPDGGDERGSCTRPQTELRQTVTNVFAPALGSENLSSSKLTWSIRTLFGIGLLSTCPLADSSLILVEDTTVGQIKAEPAPKERVERGCRSFLAYDLKWAVAENVNNPKFVYNRGQVERKALYGGQRSPALLTSRYQIGYGQERGEIVTTLINGRDKEAGVVLLDVFPWFLRVYFHTLTVTVEGTGERLKPLKQVLVPGVDRKRPFSMELALRLPAKSTVNVKVSFEKSILKWLEYPPDAAHGFYVGSAVISFPVGSDNCSAEDFGGKIYTETLLVNLPTPDFVSFA